MLLTSFFSFSSTVEDNDELLDVKKDSALPIMPNYLVNPPFPYVYNSMCSSTASISASSSNGRLSPSLEPHNKNCPISLSGTAMLQHEKSSDADITRASSVECPGPLVQNGHVCQIPMPPGRTLASPAASKQPETQQQSGPLPAFQPFFFTGAFPFNSMQGKLK